MGPTGFAFAEMSVGELVEAGRAFILFQDENPTSCQLDFADHITPVAVSFQDAIVARRDFSDLLLQVCVCRRQDDFRILKHTSKFGVKHRRSKAQNAVKLFKK